MTTIIYSHIYKISVSYLDKKENNKKTVGLIAPYDSLEKEDENDIRLFYIERNTFDKMIEGMLEKPYLKDKGYVKNDFEFLNISVRYVGYERWWLTWFSHHTNSKFDSDQDAFNDFENFLQEKGVDIRYSSDYTGFTNYSDNKYCAMGGEDRYRWEVCKCEHCLKSGKTIITH